MEKRQEIELLRIVSAFGIVWFHTSPIGKDISYSGLIVFLIMSMYFSTKSSLKNNFLLDKVKRILVPWILWLIFYGLINVFLQRPFINTNNGFIAGLLAGTKIHLWYMPFIFITMVIFNLIRQHIDKQILACVCAFFSILGFVMADFWKPWAIEMGEPWTQYANALNGVLIGVFFANCTSMLKFFLTGILIAAIFSLGISSFYVIGIVVTALVLLPNWNFDPRLKVNWLSDCTLGIYLSHPLWFGIIKRCGFSDAIFIPCLVFALSTASVWYIKKIAPNVAKYAM